MKVLALYALKTFTAIHIDDLERLLSEDPEIEFITRSATLAPTEAYSA
jgi:hypothetical protein